MNRAHRACVLTCLLAVTLATPAGAQDPDAKPEAASRIDMAKSQLASGRYNDAITNLKKALAAEPANLGTAMLLSGAYRDTGEYVEAVEVLKAFGEAPAALTLRAEL